MNSNNKSNFFLIAGPCVIENEEKSFEIANYINNICKKLKIKFIFKGSYKKANRTKLDSFTGIGDIKALEIINKIGSKLEIETLTDVHSVKDVDMVKKYVDILQIPAFLSRQTDLIVAASKTNKIINIKKGQFLSPESMRYALEKATKFGNKNIMITERGTMFGYQDLVVDFRSIYKMKKFGVPIVMDITHSLQKPNQNDGYTSGNSDMIETIAKASIATGVDGIFLETHPDPMKSKSDSSNMLKMSDLEGLLVSLINIRNVI